MGLRALGGWRDERGRFGGARRSGGAVSALVLTDFVPQAYSQIRQPSRPRARHAPARDRPSPSAPTAGPRVPLPRRFRRRPPISRRSASSRRGCATSAAPSPAKSASRCATSTAAGRRAGTASAISRSRASASSGWRSPRCSASTPASSSLDRRVTITRQDLTLFHQPIAAQIGPNGYTTTLGELMFRAITQSDNTANDTVLRRAGGPEAVRAMLAGHRIQGIRFGPGERLMQSQIAGLQWQPAIRSAAPSTPGAQRRAARAAAGGVRALCRRSDRRRDAGRAGRRPDPAAPRRIAVAGLDRAAAVDHVADPHRRAAAQGRPRPRLAARPQDRHRPGARHDPGRLQRYRHPHLARRPPLCGGGDDRPHPTPLRRAWR